MKKLIVALFLFSIPSFAKDIEMDDLVIHNIEEVRIISEMSTKNPAWLKLDANYSIKEGVDLEYVNKYYRVTCDDIAYYANNKPVSLGLPIFPFLDHIQTCSIVKLKNPDNWKWGEWENEVKFTVKYDIEILRPLIDEQIKQYISDKQKNYSEYLDYKVSTGNGIRASCNLIDLMRYQLLSSNRFRTISYSVPHLTNINDIIVLSLNMDNLYVDMYFDIDNKSKSAKLNMIYTPDGYSKDTNNLAEINQLCEVFGKWPEYVVSPYSR